MRIIYAGINLGIIGKGIMPEQCRHNRGSFCHGLLKKSKEIVHEFVPLYTCTCIQRVCGGS